MTIEDVIRYCPKTGNLYWAVNRGRNIKAGTIAGGKNHDGYLRVCVLGINYAQHRLAWFLTHGKFPEDEIDHINRIRSDNRLENLRVVSSFENSANKGKHPKNSTGFTGVVKHKSGKYQAQIKHLGTCFYLGLFESPDAANEAYQMKRKELLGNLL